MADPFTTYKLIVLYMAKHATQALTNSQISEFILDREYTDYFQLQKVLSELTETELLHKRTITNSSYYELTEEQLATILKENNLDGEKLNKIGFYSRYGGKAVGLLIIALIIWGCIPGKKKEVKPVEV